MTYNQYKEELKFFRKLEELYQQWAHSTPHRIYQDISKDNGISVNIFHEYIMDRDVFFPIEEEVNIINELAEIGLFEDEMDRNLLFTLINKEVFISYNLKYRWLDKLL